jgi:peptidoglycan/LPS O-acetylase OafA/YrhL
MPRRLESLDFLRAACALAVLFNHLYDETAGLARNAILVGLFSLGVEAVIGFFVLSGSVIALQRYPGREAYLRARAVRILPIYYIALAGCLGLMLWSREPFKLTELLGNVFFMQSLFWQPLRPLDYFFPSWSLSYELYYYAAFLLLLARPRLLLPFAVLSVAAGALLYFLPSEGPQVWLLHPVSLWCLWLAGVWIVGQCRRGRALALPSAAWLLAMGFCLTRLPLSEPAKFDFFRLLGFGLGFAALTWALLAREKPVEEGPPPIEIALPWRCGLAAIALATLWRYSHSFTGAKAAITVLVVGASLTPQLVVALVARLARSIKPFMLYVSGLSYALYLVHYPLLQAFNDLAPQLAPWIRVVLVAALSFGLAHLLEYRLQPRLRAALLKTRASRAQPAD